MVVLGNIVYDNDIIIECILGMFPMKRFGIYELRTFLVAPETIFTRDD